MPNERWHLAHRFSQVCALLDAGKDGVAYEYLEQLREDKGQTAYDAMYEWIAERRGIAPWQAGRPADIVNQQ